VIVRLLDADLLTGKHLAHVDFAPLVARGPAVEISRDLRPIALAVWALAAVIERAHTAIVVALENLVARLARNCRVLRTLVTLQLSFL